jgi:phosphoenolpyruvate carboxykinase (ATP)
VESHAARLRELTEKMPNASVTEFGNVVVKARVDSRSTRSTYIVEDSTNSRGQTITRAEYDRVSGIQDAYIAQSHMLVVDGYIGSDPQFRTRARLIMEAANANVAGMQRQHPRAELGLLRRVQEGRPADVERHRL